LVSKARSEYLAPGFFALKAPDSENKSPICNFKPGENLLCKVIPVKRLRIDFA